MRKNVWCLSLCDWITPANFLNHDNWNWGLIKLKGSIQQRKQQGQWGDSLQNGRKCNLKNGAIKPKREFSKEEIQMSIKYFKNMFNILSHCGNANWLLWESMSPISEWQSLRNQDSKCGKEGTPPHCWWECKLILSPWKAVWSYSTS